MNEFDELEAMKKIAAALEPLDAAARARALQWAVSRFHGSGAPMAIGSLALANERGGEPAISGPFGSFAELFDAASPSTEKDKALVAAYWMQVCQGATSFPAQSLNDLLKDLGHRVGNITEALNQLKSDRPALVLQLKKSGTSKQARKTYKLTMEGARRVSAITQELASSNE
ncbi:MAG: hypothetical protein ACLP19_13235 [Xanthobacteraceae bacterium]